MKKILLFLLGITFSISILYAQSPALDFADDYVIVSDNPSLDFTTNITIECWVYLNSYGSYSAIFGKNSNWSTWSDGFGVYYSGTFLFWINNWTTNTLSFTFPPNTWSHVACTYDGSEMRVYVNGVLANSKSYTLPIIDYPSPFVIGNANPYPSGGWYGTIDEMRLWNVARTQSEIQQYMNTSLPNPGSQTGLVGYWNFDENNGQVVNDQSSSSNDGQLGDLPTTDAKDPSWGTGVLLLGDNCLSFDGSNDYVEIPNDASLNPTNEITIEAWYKPVSFYGNGSDPILSKGFTSHTPPYYQYHLYVGGNTYINNPGVFGFSLTIGGVPYNVTTTQNFWNPDRWYHLSGVYNGSVLKLYVDGIEVDSEPATGLINDYGMPVRIASFNNYPGYLPGNIDEVRIWNTARTETEIRENIHRELPNPAGEANLVAYYKFNQSGGTSLPDYSTHGNDGTLMNMDPATDWVASTAPIPFNSVQDGPYISTTTWDDGQFYPANSWSRVAINHDVLVDEPVVAIDITIENAGILNIGTTPAAVEVTGNLVNNAGVSGIVMQSSAAGHGSLIENDGVEATVQRYFTGNDIDWHLVSSPVSNAQSDIFTDMYLQQFNESTGAYNEVTSTGNALNPMQGYALYSNLSSSNTVTFEGSLNTGSHTAIVTAYNPNGWNLIGNPFASSIDWNAVIPGLSANISNSVYYLDAATGNWLTWNGTTGSGSRYIPPMQGFFISASAGDFFTVDNSMRTRMGSGNFYKEDVSNLLVLKADGNGFEDKTYIHFNDEATASYDNKFDAYKIFSDFNDDLPQLFTKIGQDNLSINELPEAESMVLGFKAGSAGIYSIGLDEVNDIATIILEDTESGITTDLLSNSYSFNYSVGDLSERFVIHFSPLAVNDINGDNMDIYAAGNTVFVNMENNVQAQYSFLNMMGQKVTQGTLSSKPNAIHIKSETGFYLLKIESDQSVITKKVFIHN